jgi:glycosyltransferase involved in cell wall biosynthesis
MLSNHKAKWHQLAISRFRVSDLMSHDMQNLKTEEKTIALIDWNWMGHHPSYFSFFASAIAEAGARVLPFCPEPDDFMMRLQRSICSADAHERISSALQINGPTASTIRPGRWRAHHEAFLFFTSIRRRLKEWEAQNNKAIDLVFFACIYDRAFEHFRLVERWFGYPWSGLYLHARSFRMPGSPIPYSGGLPCPEEIFSSSLLRSVAVLDERAIEPMIKITGGKPVTVFPDLSLLELPDNRTERTLAHKIKTFAAGRPIVSLTGHLQWTKGLDTFTAAAAHPDMKDVLFFLGGDINWWQISAHMRANLQRQWEDLPNFYGHFLQILDERTINSIISMSSVVCATYLSFPNSSNILTKAAAFKRPVVVSDGYLMAERVRRYQLGEVIPEGDAQSLVISIKQMLLSEYQVKLSARARWSDYIDDNSQERLVSSFQRILSSV